MSTNDQRLLRLDGLRRLSPPRLVRAQQVSIRRYGDEQTVFLERKLRQPAVLAKRRTSLPLSSLSH